MENEVLSEIETEYLIFYGEEDTVFLKKYIKLIKTASVKIGLIQSEQNNIVRLLVNQPFPTLKLLALNYGRSKFLLTKAITSALKIYIEENKTELSSNYLSFLANFPDTVLEANTLRQSLLDLLVKNIFNIHLGIVLMCRKSNYLLETLLTHWKNLPIADEILISKEYIAYQTIECNQHFLPVLVKSLNDFSKITDDTIRNILIILKLSNEFSDKSRKICVLRNINDLLNKFELSAIPSHLKVKHEFYYKYYQRINQILNFLKNDLNWNETLKVDDIFKITSILELIYNHGLKIRFDDVRKTIEGMYKLHSNESNIKNMYEMELETLIHFSIMDIVIEILFSDTTFSKLNNNHNYKNHIVDFHKLLRQIKNLKLICQIIKNIFQIFFLRWEDLNTDTCSEYKDPLNVKRSKSGKFPLSSSTEFTESDINIKKKFKRMGKTKGDNMRNGFICQGPSLHLLLIHLKQFTTKTLHSQLFKTADNIIKHEFQIIVDSINEILWKFTLITEIEKPIGLLIAPKICLAEDDINKVLCLHEPPNDLYTSDEENLELCKHGLNNHRSKIVHKRRRATFCGVIESHSFQRNNLKTQRPQEARNTCVPETLTSSKVKSNNSIIPKLLVTPPNFVHMAQANNKYDEAKCIIERYNLQNTTLGQELRFIDEQKKVKEKLSIIYANYQKLDSSARNPHEPIPTVEQIKTVAAKGFEMSKIINVVDNFARSYPIQQSPELKKLLSKYANNRYPFLHVFESNNLNAFVVTDLILELPFNREIMSNIIKVIKRQQQMNADIASAMSKIGSKYKEQSLLPKDIGPMGFLENLCECLRLMEQIHNGREDSISLCGLLSNNFYSLKPKKLVEELHHKQVFDSVFYKTHAEIGRLEDLRACGSLTQNITTQFNFYGRFLHYIEHLNKVSKLCDSNLELHTTELLKCDPYCIIGDLIFECEMAPMEIEKYATALNINLAHLIALNISPRISDEPILRVGRFVPEIQYDIIMGYIQDQSPLLAYLLKSIINLDNFHMDATINPVFLQRYLELQECTKLSTLYNGNRLIAALRVDYIKMNEIEHIESKIDQLELLFIFRGNDEFRKLRTDKIDALVLELIAMDSKNIILAKYINDNTLRAQLVLKTYTHIQTSELAQEIIKLTLTHKDAQIQISLDLRQKLQNTLSNIQIYAEVSGVLQLETWTQAYDFGLKTPNKIFESLLRLQMYDLCYNWILVIDLKKYFAQNKRLLLNKMADFLLQMQDSSENADLNKSLIKIIETFPVEDCIELLDKNKDKFRSISLLEYAIKFLSQKSVTNYKNYSVSLEIFRVLKMKERAQFWTLLKFPLLIVEQLIMNSRFEILSRVLQAVRQCLHADKLVNSDGERQYCSFCFDKHGNVYDIHTKGNTQRIRFQLGADTSHSPFILLNFNLYQLDHIITNECVDLLLRIYATKALDYYVSSNVDFSDSSGNSSQGTEMQSLDSLCGAFQIPKVVPTREEWIRDEDATHCMCCRRARFTMLMRRHHCRRCGRVVCYACSMQRAFIPELYAELAVRVCKDCQKSLEESSKKMLATPGTTAPEFPNSILHCHDKINYKWELSGNITHDKLLREEFGYDHAPSVALCLSILEYHLDQQKCVDLLLYHCRKLEKLIVPNPEVDFELVAKMMNCLALAAKVRGAPPEVETIREHSEIIIAVVHNGCADLIPPGPLDNNSLRKLADSLVQAEHWKLALEVHLKCGFSTAGVMAANGLACLRAGCYETARERFSHCMTKLSNEHVNNQIEKYIFINNKIKRDKIEEDISKAYDIPIIKRPKRSQPLLKEILSVINALPIIQPQPETVHRASLMRTSNTSLASLFTRRKEQYAIPPHEPALNILTRLTNLKNIRNGQYCEAGLRHMHVLDYNETQKEKSRQTRNFEESLLYVLTYGSHSDILDFLTQHHELTAAIRYYLFQNLDPEYFINNIYLKLLSCNQIPYLIKHMQDMVIDDYLIIWRNTFLQTCRYLETNKLLNSLYQLQMLINDPIRASMTCVKFYSMNCENFCHLHANSEHLNNARIHLQGELEKSQWETLKFDNSIFSGLRKKSFMESGRRSSATSTSQTGAVSSSSSIPMQLDARSLNTHINTILLQLEVAKFLAKCEVDNSSDNNLITDKILKQMRIESDKTALPTLFDSIQDKIQNCVLILYCGKNIEEGFGLAYRIIQDYKILPIKVYAATAKYLALNQRFHDVEKLIICIAGNNDTSTHDVDEILSVAIHSAVNTHDPDVKTALDNLVKKIQNIEMRISAHIFIGQLKSAYLIANKYERLSDIRKILRQAERLNQIHIKKLCEKKLNINITSTKS